MSDTVQHARARNGGQNCTGMTCANAAEGKVFKPDSYSLCQGLSLLYFSDFQEGQFYFIFGIVRSLKKYAFKKDFLRVFDSFGPQHKVLGILKLALVLSPGCPVLLLPQLSHQSSPVCDRLVGAGGTMKVVGGFVPLTDLVSHGWCLWRIWSK